MRKLVVFYSFEGNTRFIANIIAEEAEADLLELKPENENMPKGFMKYLWGGKKVYSGERPNLKSFDIDPHDYDLILIGTPVWAWTYTPAINTFLHEYKLNNKKIGLFCCSASNSGKTLDKMKEKIDGSNVIVGEIEFFDPLKKDKEKDEKSARKWIKEIIDNVG